MERITIKDAVSLIKDGDMITFSGFTIWRRPMAIVYEMVRQQKRNLHIAEVNGGTHSEILVGAGCVGIWESCWSGHELYGKLGEMVADRHLNGGMIIEDYSHGHMVARLLAGAWGLPFMPCALAMGTDILNPDYDSFKKAGLRDGSHPEIPAKKYDIISDPFFGSGDILLLPALNPTWAIVYASQAGEEGTIRVNAQTYADPEIIKGADKVIVVAEEIVPESYLRQDPKQNIAAGYAIDYLVELPWAAHPTGSQGYYDVDGDFIKDFYQASKSQSTFDKWAEEWIFKTADHSAYLEKLGITRLEKLRANNALGYSKRAKRGTR
ncbi:MAG: CoA transferase subunit A [Deltaproteobacteria bacterium]